MNDLVRIHKTIATAFLGVAFLFLSVGIYHVVRNRRHIMIQVRGHIAVNIIIRDLCEQKGIDLMVAPFHQMVIIAFSIFVFNLLLIARIWELKRKLL